MDEDFDSDHWTTDMFLRWIPHASNIDERDIREFREAIDREKGAAVSKALFWYRILVAAIWIAAMLDALIFRGVIG